MPSAEQELYDLLNKEGSETGTDDNETTVGVNPEPYPEPEDRPKGDIDASWGEKDLPANAADGDAMHFSDAVADQVAESRQRILDRYFDSKGSADDNAKKTVGQLFETRSFESSAPVLETLSEQLRRKV
jgi:hypothetical protein